MTEPTVLYEARGAVALITLNRPQALNSFTRADAPGAVGCARPDRGRQVDPRRW